MFSCNSIKVDYSAAERNSGMDYIVLRSVTVTPESEQIRASFKSNLLFELYSNNIPVKDIASLQEELNPRYYSDVEIVINRESGYNPDEYFTVIYSIYDKDLSKNILSVRLSAKNRPLEDSSVQKSLCGTIALKTAGFLYE